MTDRRKDTSRALTEVRTVLSRAETALDALAHDLARKGEEVIVRWERKPEGGMRPVYGTYEPDPEVALMISAMEGVVLSLERWRGSRKSRGQQWREYRASL